MRADMSFCRPVTFYTCLLKIISRNLCAANNITVDKFDILIHAEMC